MYRANQLRWVGFVGVLVLTAATLAGELPSEPWPAAMPMLAAAVAGMGLLVLAWTLLGRVVTGAADAPDSRWLRWTLVLWGGPLLVAPPLFSEDVYSYLAQGEIAARGLDPYAAGPAEALGPSSAITERVSDYWSEAPSPYGPVFGGFQRGIAEITEENVVASVLAYRLVAVAGLALIVWAVPRLADVAGARAPVALWLGVLNPLVLWHFVAGMHNDSLMIGLMLAGTAFALQALGERFDPARLALGVALIAAGASVKLPAVVALAVVGTALARRRGGGPVRLAGSGAAMVLAVLLVAAVGSLLSGLGFGWLGTLGTSGGVNSWMAPTNWFGFLTGGIGSLFGAQITQTMIGVGRIIGYVLIVSGLIVVIRRQLQGRIPDVAALGAMLGLVVVFGPVVQPWYVLWAAIPFALCLPSGRARTALAAALTIFSVLIPPLAGDFTGKVGELVLAYVVGLLVVGGCFAFLRASSRHETTEVSPRR
ncbi:polyprenol phosphomannose-dependent alpha 1,6 mannosyltransferase MptB [Amycolatopsis antarctica]|uniref:polyprenol phosphomannose-dependent alpha 1,6 mannosyltransferase MptB n=1 Tax=Amycolatopsis antarctica TaxID=1854586 RepID=UPI0013FDB1C3|nr:polyprenol phosphomannose-dependent alpha 1,6 mannosyltransferase MptB [Amycolatopsis antarctica]